MTDDIEGAMTLQEIEVPTIPDPFTCSLIWATPDADQLVGYMARVSNSKAKPEDSAEKLIGFLIRNHHWSPFQMVNMCVEINTTRDISAQILRHQSAHFQEFSTRYADIEDLIWFRECRFQDEKNRQNSFTVEQHYTEREPQVIDPGYDDGERDKVNGYNVEETVSYWDALVNESRVRGMEGYGEARRRGVAKETARAILPFGLIPTKLYMNGTARTWIHYLSERTKPGVQKEHRDIALKVLECFRESMPSIFRAFDVWQTEERKKAMLWKMWQDGTLENLIDNETGVVNSIAEILEAA